MHREPMAPGHRLGSVAGRGAHPRRRLELVSGRSHPVLAEEIADHLGVELGERRTSRVRQRRDPLPLRASSIRGCDVFIIQTHCGPVNDSLMEQLIMIDAAKRASAKRITAVCPYYGYSRQDRKSTGREPITAKLVADMLQAAGADRVVSVDLHSGQIQGFFDVPFDHLTAAPVLEGYLRQHVTERPGGGRPRRRAGQGGRALQPAPRGRPGPGAQDPAAGHRPTQVEARHVVGEVEGRHCVLIDDMIDTAGHHLRRRGAAGRSGGGRHLGHGHPRAALGPRRRPAEGVAHLAGWWSPTPCRSAAERDLRQARGAVGGQDHRRRHRRRLRGHLGVGDLRWREPGLRPGSPRAAPIRPATRWLADGRPRPGRLSVAVRRGPARPCTRSSEETRHARDHPCRRDRPAHRVSSDTRRLRAEGKIPGVVYGHGIDPVRVAVAPVSCASRLSGESGTNTLLSLEGGRQDLLPWPVCSSATR